MIDLESNTVPISFNIHKDCSLVLLNSVVFFFHWIFFNIILSQKKIPPSANDQSKMEVILAAWVVSQ